MTVEARVDKQGIVRCGRQYASGRYCDFPLGEQRVTSDPSRVVVHLDPGWVPAGSDSCYRLSSAARNALERARQRGEAGSFRAGGRRPPVSRLRMPRPTPEGRWEWANGNYEVGAHDATVVCHRCDAHIYVAVAHITPVEREKR